MSNLQLRIISAIVMATVVLALTWFGGLPFRLLSAAIAAAVFFEWCAMSRTSANSSHQLVAGALFAAVLAALALGYPAFTVIALLGASVVACAIDALVRGQGAWTVGGLAYAGLTGISLAFLRDGDYAGLSAILFLFAVVWTTDIAAYFVGRSLGGPKLAPRISPGKTWSGAIGGGIGGILAGIVAGLAVGADNVFMIGLVALLLSVVSQIGDLFESWVKRRHGVKDSGNLIPGHGGVMDRVDGLVAAAFALYVIGCLLGSADNPAQGLFVI